MKKYKVNYYIENAGNLESSYTKVIESNHSLHDVIDTEQMYLAENKFIQVHNTLLNVNRISEVVISEGK